MFLFVPLLALFRCQTWGHIFLFPNHHNPWLVLPTHSNPPRRAAWVIIILVYKNTHINLYSPCYPWQPTPSQLRAKGSQLWRVCLLVTFSLFIFAGLCSELFDTTLCQCIDNWVWMSSHPHYISFVRDSMWKMVWDQSLKNYFFLSVSWGFWSYLTNL